MNIQPSSDYTANATCLNKRSKGFKVLEHIILKDGVTKYECVTRVLGKIGTRKELRGWYSCYFRGWVDSGVVTLDRKTHMYHSTKHGAVLYFTVSTKS